MPFDNPHQMPFGDLELLMEARGRISSREAWVRAISKKMGATVSWPSLSLTCGSRSFGMPNRTELAAISADCHADAVRRAILDSTQVHAG